MINEALKTELTIIANDLRAAFAQNNVNASGALSNSLEVQISTSNTQINGKLLANSYIDTVDTGRAPNQTNSGGLLEGIRDWLRYGKYGLPNTERVAIAITRNIARKGSYLYRNKIDRKIVSGIINDNRIDKILERIASEYRTEAVNNLKV